MATNEPAPVPPTTDETTPETVRETFQGFVEFLHENDVDEAPFVVLLTPRSRFKCIRVLLGATEPLTSREIAEDAGIDYSTWSDQHRDILLASGVIESPGKKGNAQVFTVNHDHPVAQLIQMADMVFRKGTTPNLLDAQFVGRPEAEYEPGDHPADPRDD